MAKLVQTSSGKLVRMGGPSPYRAYETHGENGADRMTSILHPPLKRTLLDRLRRRFAR
jgi:hypothetical protein